jgi:diguanylate cyclase (GGDEF)-like protein/PAS domain S-box-containing protein
LDRARRFAENLVDMLPHPVWVKDAAGELQMYNRAFRHMFGLPEDNGAMPTPLDGLDRLSDQDLLAEGKGRLTCEVALEMEGGQRTVMLSKGLLTGENSVVTGTIGLITDITERKSMERQLRQLATTDDLTGTLNRRAFFAAAEQEMERAVRYGNAVSVVMFDLDHFKQVNDSHGHAVGDQALREAATALRASLRDVDILGRLGGEEFAVLLPETPLAGAVEVAERLRHAISAIRIPLEGGRPPLTLTASLGVAERLAEEITVDKVLARADLALYRAKADGRNRVMG